MLLKTYLKRILAESAYTPFFGGNENSRKGQSLTFVELISMPFVPISMNSLSFNSDLERSDKQCGLFISQTQTRWYLKGSGQKNSSSVKRYNETYGMDPDLELSQKKIFN